MQYFKGSASAPVTIAIDRYYSYDNTNKFKLSVSGKTKNNTNGETIVIGGKGISTSTSVQYKVVSTISNANSINNIKSGAGFDTYWTNVNINGSTVSSYSTAYYYNGTISALNDSSVEFNIRKE